METVALGRTGQRPGEVQLVAIPIDTSRGTPIRWIGAAREEMTGPDTTDWVRPEDVGTFLDFDGPPGHHEVVVSFPTVGALVCSVD
ncbi:MAG TPA: hypothetical protein VFI46_12430, partial [Jiangellaceae bacterium]|nr:hypothetical protein [Jiangellaceae bacterium]